jgi:hypothetical protein
MAANNNISGRGRERGITSLALTTAHIDEAPERPGAKRKPQAAVTGGAGFPRGAANNPRGRAAFEETLRCPLCGKLVRRHSAPFHAISHFERLERRGVLQLSRENGGWVVLFNGKRYYGAGWRTLCAIAEGVVVSG